MKYYTDIVTRVSYPLMNACLLPLESTEVDVGPNEVNSPTTLTVVSTQHPRVDGPQDSQCLVGHSVYAGADATLKPGQKHRSVWGINVAVRVGPGEHDDPSGKQHPDDQCGIEVDVINELSDAPTDVLAPGHSYGYWAQANSATNRKAGSAFFASDTGCGWQHAFYADGNFNNWLGYLRTTVNAPTAKGLFVETQWADPVGTVIEARVAGQTKFKVDGGMGLQSGVWLRINGNLRQIEYGEPNSAGHGYRTLRVKN